MSWTVDGNTYHDYEEYQAALRRKEAREAGQYASQAREELDRYQRRLLEQQQTLERAQGDLARQRQINEDIRQDVLGIEREQRTLANAQAAFEQQSRAQLGELRTNMRGMSDGLARAERDHQEHVEATRRAFAESDRALQAGLADAQRQREEGERRLQSEIRAVDQKVEHDRQERLRRQRSDLDQAREQIAMVEEVLGQVADKLRPLNLEEHETSVRFNLDAAQRQLRAGNAAAALSMAETAFTGAQTLGYACIKRRAELTANAGAIANRIESIREFMKAETLEKYFKTEKAELIGHLSRLAGRLQGRYQQYSRMEDDLREDSKIVESLEDEARGMLAMCPTLAEQIAARKDRITSIVEKTANSYGGSPKIQSELAQPGDLKSDLIVNCTFSGGAKVRIEANVDGGYRVDGAGHGSQDECDRRAAELVRILGDETHVTGHQTLANNPSELPASTSARRTLAWRNVGDRLRDIGQRI